MDEQVEEYDMAGWNLGNQIFWLRLGLLDRCVLCLGRSRLGSSTLGRPVLLGMISACWWEMENELLPMHVETISVHVCVRRTVTYAFKIHCGPPR